MIFDRFSLLFRSFSSRKKIHKRLFLLLLQLLQKTASNISKSHEELSTASEEKRRSVRRKFQSIGAFSLMMRIFGESSGVK
jgi:hypothetical protein